MKLLLKFPTWLLTTLMLGGIFVLVVSEARGARDLENTTAADVYQPLTVKVIPGSLLLGPRLEILMMAG